MSVYVDEGRIAYRGMKMCHMIADTLEELHEMAATIGLKREWFQDHETPHYDICQRKKLLAISRGALIADRRKVVELIRYWRAKRNSE